MSTTEKPSSAHASEAATATAARNPASSVVQLPLRARLARLTPYFGYQRWTWVLAVMATVVVAKWSGTFDAQAAERHLYPERYPQTAAADAAMEDGTLLAADAHEAVSPAQ